MRYKDVYIIWTVYLNSKLPRKKGRRIPLNEAVPNPTLEELFNACKKQGLKVIDYKEASYPRIWWVKNAYVVIEKGNYKKGKLLRLIAKEIRRLRGGR